MDWNNVDTLAVKMKYINIIAFVHNIWGKFWTFPFFSFLKFVYVERIYCTPSNHMLCFFLGYGPKNKSIWIEF